MSTTILRTDTLGALTIVQLLNEPLDTFPFVSSERALAGGLATVEEISEAGSVNLLDVVNHSPHHILFLDGDILQGAKQNRVLNSTVLIPPRSRTRIPVSCVERGRWHHTTAAFSKAAFCAPSPLRYVKAAAKARIARSPAPEPEHGASAAQDEVWNYVEKLQEQAGTVSETEDLGDVYKQKSRELEAFLEKLQPAPGANGLAILHNNRLVSLDIFNRADILCDNFAKLLRGTALTLLETPTTKTAAPRDPAAAIRKALKTAEKHFPPPAPSPGAGLESHFATREIAGFRLEHEGCLIHLGLVTATP